jgi:beta-lactamase regulating signal transducer with metallopeptidase domain
MTLSQMIVVAWVQFAVAAALLLYLTQAVASRLVQPADRIRLILLSLVAVTAVPIFAAWAPWPSWRLHWISPSNYSRPAEALALVQRGPVASVGATDRQSSQSTFAAKHSQQDTATESAAISVHSPVATVSTRVVPVPSRTGLWDVAAIAIAVVHGMALFYLFLEWGIGYLLLHRLRRNATASTVALDREWSFVTKGRGQHVSLLVSQATDTPLMFGWFRPVVLLPKSLVDQGGASLTFCMAHEWSHIERGDMLAWNCLRLGQVFLWFVPSYWTLRTELRLCQDMLADDRATRAKADAVEYSELLVSFAKQRMKVPVAAALTFLHHPSQLTKRIKMLLLKSVSVRAHCTWKFSLATGIASLLVAAVFGAVRLDATLADDAKQDSAAAKDEKKEAAATPVVPLKYNCRVVEKDTGKGIPNARVVVRRSVSSSTERRVVEESKHTTDAEGNYLVEIPEAQVADRYMYIELDVEHDDFAPKKGHGYALGMILKNEKLGERPFFEKTELYASEPVTGTIVSPEGKPVGGVKVQSFSMASPNDFNSLSFNDTLSDADGKFRLNLHKGSDGILWVIPKNFVVTEKFLAKQRGDLGKFVLSEGVRISGRVVGADEKPIAGVPVNIDFVGERDTGGLPVSTSVGRGTLSDVDGRFSFDPLGPGDYSIVPGEHLSDPIERDRTRYEVPAVFISKKLSIKEGVAPAAVELQAVPHVLFHAQIVDGAGKKTGGHEFFLYGQIDGGFWHAQGRPNKEGTVVLKVPHGLQETRVQLMTNEHGALRYRRGPGQPLQNEVRNIDFGTLNSDVEGFEIVRYKAPLVLVSAVGEDQKPIENFGVAGTYPWGQQQYVVEGEARSDMSFEKQNDGRHRTSQMLPDEEVTFKVTAKGYESATEKVTLKEGETKELIVTLKKDDGTSKKDAAKKDAPKEDAEKKPE